MIKLKRGKKSGLKYFDYNYIKSLNPCYDPIKYIYITWRGTAVDILKMENVPFQDRLWLVFRTDLTSERTMRLFSAWCYKKTLKFTANPDPRSINAANVAERFANGEATVEELSTADSAALSAYYDTNSDGHSTAAAVESSYTAVHTAALSASDSAGAAAWSAASSAFAAAWHDSTVVCYDAHAAARSAQRDKLIEMIKTESKEYKCQNLRKVSKSKLKKNFLSLWKKLMGCR